MPDSLAGITVLETIALQGPAVPIVDRIIHHSRIFILGGESYRPSQKVGN